MVDSTLLGDWTEQYAGTQLNLSGFHLNFADEFNAMSVGGSYGSPETYDWFAPARTGFGAATLVEPTAPVNPFTLGNGTLTLSMQQVNGVWQTGHMQTVNANGQGYTQQYGYFEMSAKFPAGAGTWPAFWLLSNDPTKPRVEIDIVEAYGDDDHDGHHAAVHFTPSAGSSLTQKVDNSEYNTIKGSMFDGQFHTYGALVTPEWIIVYYDRVELARFASNEFVGTPLYMSVTLAGYSTLSQANPNTKYDMVVDYVRAYADPRFTGLVLNGTSAGESLQGNQYADTIDGAAGADTLIGGAGDDAFHVDNAGDKVVEAAGGGVDVVYTSVSFSAAGQDIENVVGTGTGTINLTGNGLANKLAGNAGANVLDGAAGADTMSGGAGDDIYYVDNAGDRVVEGWDQGSDTVYSSVSFSAPGAYIENVTLTGTANINAIGTDLDNRLTGNAGANVLDGGTGADTMTGGAGDDTYYVDNAGDRVIEAPGEGVDTIMARVTVDLRTIANVEHVTLTMDQAIHAWGNDFNNRLTGNAYINLLEGGAGDDTLSGGFGNDRLVGGDGKDVFVFDGALSATGNVDILPGFSVADDTIRLDPAVFTALSSGALAAGALRIGAQAGDADDRIIYNYNTGDLFYDPDGTGSAAQVLFAKIGNGQALTDADFVVGGPAATLVAPSTPAPAAPAPPPPGSRTGTAGADTFAAVSGADTMAGGAGDDVYNVDDAGDRVIEAAGEGVDSIAARLTIDLRTIANVENATLLGDQTIHAWGNELNNRLTGNTNVNLLEGGAGDDTLSGGFGNDRLVGGDGKDVFVFDGALSATGNVDILPGFSVADDTIRLDPAVFTALSSGALAAGALRIGAQAGDADDRIIYNYNTGDLFYDPDGTGAAAQVLFAKIGNGQALTDADFVVGGPAATLVAPSTPAPAAPAPPPPGARTGTAGADTFAAVSGADTMAGGAGDDVYYLDDAGDRVTEAVGEGVDSIVAGLTVDLRTIANVENVTLLWDQTIHAWGNELNNRLTGNTNVNLLEGGAGDDTLSGGFGNDRLVGGDGSDVFVFDGALSATGNVDILPGFSVADDTIHLENSIFAGLAEGVLAASAFRIGAQAGDADDRIIYNYNTGDLFYDADGTGAAAQVLFAKIGNGQALTNADFLVI